MLINRKVIINSRIQNVLYHNYNTFCFNTSIDKKKVTIWLDSLNVLILLYNIVQLTVTRFYQRYKRVNKTEQGSLFCLLWKNERFKCVGELIFL